MTANRNPDDTIVAISTPIGEGGIGIVRLSGKLALAIINKIFESKNERPPFNFKTYTIRYGHIIKNSVNANKPLVIDEVIVSVMKAPKSYTREDVVEINCHGGIVPLRKIFDLVIEMGARPAEPGEFTKRAFLNGRIDLARAEAVLDVIRSKTDAALEVAMNQLNGRLSECVCNLQNDLLDIYSHIEASLDFPDEELQTSKTQELIKKSEGVALAIDELIKKSDKGIVLRDGIAAVICGSPNVGKSSLLNALLRIDRAIVTPIPGTTRDTIEEIANIKGIPLKLVDTAGIMDSQDLVEREGINRSRRHIRSSDLVLFVLDASRPLTREDEMIARELKDKKVIIIINKIDQAKKMSMVPLSEFASGNKVVEVSALAGTNLNLLEDAIADVVWRGGVAHTDELLVSNARPKNLLKASLAALSFAIDGLREHKAIELVALDFREAIDALSRISGAKISSDVLDVIFNEFCIGK